MKKFAKTASIALVVCALAASAFLLTACFSIPMHENTPEATQLHGRWNVVRFKEQTGGSTHIDSTRRGFIQFNADGTFSENSPWHQTTSLVSTGNWSITGDTLTMTRTGGAVNWGPTRTIGINDDADRITIRYTGYGGTWTVEFQRA